MELDTVGYFNSTTTTTTTTGIPMVVAGDELKLGILKICLFSTFFVLGLIGNSLVLIGIGLNKGMQTTTNLLIFNLALADVLFIIVCIPTTLCSFFGRWPFTEIGCKLAQFINHLSAFMSIFLLVFMSIDRYLAVVHAIDSISNYRTAKNTTICIVTLWLIGICISLPIGSLFTVIEYSGDHQSVSMYCVLRYLRLDGSMSISSNSTELMLRNLSNFINETSRTNQIQILPIEASLYWIGFALFLYALPLTIIVILYGLMLKFLRGARGQSVGKNKRRATRMILAVILTYALCWLPMQLLFVSNVILSRNTSHNFANYMDILMMFANVFAYLNSCTNPILYGFMSKNFRSSFIDLLCCRYSKRYAYTPNDSVRHRRAADNQNNNPSKYRSDYMARASMVSRCSQFGPATAITTGCASGNSAISPPSYGTHQKRTSLTTELSPMREQLDSSQIVSAANNSACRITVGTQTNSVNEPTNRRRKHADRSAVVAYCSLSPHPAQQQQKHTQVLCT